MVERRRFLLVDKDFQYSFALTAVLLVVILLNLLVLLGFYLLDPLQQFVVTFTHISAVAAFELGVIALVTFYSLKHSRAIAGPVQGMQRGLNAVAQGDLTVRLSLRDGEFFEDMLLNFNQNIEQLELHVARAKELAKELQQLHIAEDGCAEKLAELNNHLDRIKTGDTAATESSGMGAS